MINKKCNFECRECEFKAYAYMQEQKENNKLGIAGVVIVLIIFILAIILL